MRDVDPPIQNMDSFDIVGVRKDGGVDVVVACSGPLDDSAETLWRLGQKTRNYLREIASQDFLGKYGYGSVRIFISCQYEVSTAAQDLISSLQIEASAQCVGLSLVERVA